MTIEELIEQSQDLRDDALPNNICDTCGLEIDHGCECPAIEQDLYD